MSKLGAEKPKKSSIISNLLNRVDGKSIGVKEIKNNEEILLFWTVITEKHTKANKEVLRLLSDSELNQLLDGDDLAKNYSLNMFNFLQHIPEKIVEPKIKEAVVVRSYKETDKVGTSKGEKEVFEKKDLTKTKRTRING